MRIIIRLLAGVALVVMLIVPGPALAQEENWLVNLSLTTAPHIGTVPGAGVTFAFGARDGATDGYDEAEGDQIAPPDPMAGVSAYFYYPDNPMYQRNLVTSVVGPAQTITWPLLVKSVGDPGATQATLTWNGGDIGNIPGKYTVLELRNTAGATLADMRSQGSYTFSLESNETRNFHVVAEQVIYTIMATAGAGGGISPEGEVTVAHGADRTFTITADKGSQIDGVLVDGESIGAVETYTFENVISHHTIHAIFEEEIPRYGLTMTAVPPGTGTAVDLTDGSPYGEGASVEIKALAQEGYQFFMWTAPAGEFDDAFAEETIFTMPGDDVTVTAYFVVDVKTETVTDGIVNAKAMADTEVVVSGTATVTVALYDGNPGGPDPTGFKALGKWVDIYVPNVDEVQEVTIRLYYTADELAAAGVSEALLRLFWWDDSAWIACDPSGVNTAGTHGYSGYIWAEIRTDTTPSLAQLTGTPFGGYGTSPPPPPPSPSPSPSPPPIIPSVEYALTVASTIGGSVVEPGEGTFAYDQGTVVALLAEPEQGYRFVNWSGDVDNIADVNAAETTVVVDNAYAITASFEHIPVQYDLVISSTTGGSVTTPGEGASAYDEGTVVVLIVRAEKGYRFVNWSGDVDTIADVGAATTTIVMEGDYTITAEFKEARRTFNMALIIGIIGGMAVVGLAVFFVPRKRPSRTQARSSEIPFPR